jgi:hypothetical protein
VEIFESPKYRTGSILLYEDESTGVVINTGRRNDKWYYVILDKFNNYEYDLLEEEIHIKDFIY